MVTNVQRVFLTAVFILWAFAVVPVPAFADHAWGTYHWARTSNPFTLKLGDNVSSAWDSYLVTTASNTSTGGWGLSTVLNTMLVAGGTRSKTCKPTSGQVEVCSDRYGNNGWLGIAQIWISGGHITQGVVKLNDTYFNTAKYNTPAWRNLVMCQEVGHTFGLDHQDETFDNANLGTCMDYTNDPDGTLASQPDNQYQNDHDYEELEIIYNHIDSTNTAAQTVQSRPGKGQRRPALANTDSDEPVELGTAQWGKLMRSTNRGRTELYELDLGRGHKILTHVIWADPEEEPGPQRGRR